MLHTEELATCPVLNEADNYHFEMRCEDCDVKTLSQLNLGQVEERFHVGRVTRDEFEAYMHVWATLSPGGSRATWRETPEDPAVRRIARKVLAARSLPIPADLLEEWEVAA
jgi:hypothetical protein